MTEQTRVYGHRAVMDALMLAICACALGPWVAALWATGGFTKGGSSRWLRRLVRCIFWVALLAALALTVLDLVYGHRRGD